MSKGIPALTLSGGKLSEFGGKKAVKEYRIWVHRKAGGDDEYSVFPPTTTMTHLRNAVRAGRSTGRFSKVEAPVAVVWDPKYKKYREVVIDTPRKRKAKPAINPATIGMPTKRDIGSV